MVQRHAGPKLVGHLSRDATAIEAPERPVAKPAPEPAAPRPPPPLKRLELQGPRSLAENLADLPHACDVGPKCNSKGYKSSWTGLQAAPRHRRRRPAGERRADQCQRA